jgi:hypothetical protein
VVTILNQIYEVDFKGFSYGFRPGRSPHQALDALYVGIQRKRVNWVLDADIRGFLDKRWHPVIVFCVLLSFFAFAAGPFIGYSRETEHVGLMIALWAPTLGILGVRAELLQRREEDLLKKNVVGLS